MNHSDPIRTRLRSHILASEDAALAALIAGTTLTDKDRLTISEQAVDLVKTIRAHSRPRLMESFLEEYGLSTREGIALMCLAEALLRVPDPDTIDALIEDKIAPSDWGRHLGQSSSSLVNSSTWALMLTGKVLEDNDEGLSGALHGAIKRLSEPVIRTAITAAMKELGRQFVLGRDIGEAMSRAEAMEGQGYTYSYDMLGEAALTAPDAAHYAEAYQDAIDAIAGRSNSDDIRQNPGISIKLSALHPRYEFSQRKRVLDELVPVVSRLARRARDAQIGLNIDAEEADRLDLSLDVIERVLSDPALSGWDGFGVVVQAYGQRAPYVIDWLHALAEKLDRKIMVRLVKGAYWDSEIKHAQTLGLNGFPVFTRKASTDVSYIACAQKLLGLTQRIYPQFATHNAHSVAAILHMAGGDTGQFEFQRLHGMGEALHEQVLKAHGTRCRIYAPVGAHRDLLAYLVRRLLENGANSSFVNQIVDEDVPPEEIAADPFAQVSRYAGGAANPNIAHPSELFPGRANSKGRDLADPVEIAAIETERAKYRNQTWEAGPILAVPHKATKTQAVMNPAKPDDQVGQVIECEMDDVEAALGAAKPWNVPAKTRKKVLERAASLYEAQACAFYELATREAGKTLSDCVNEVREAVDFLTYYAMQAGRLESEEPCGVFTCISPWNFPLAIFTGQIAAALAAGNGVLAKPAEATPLIAAHAVKLLHEAGVPRDVLQLLPGKGSSVGASLVSDPRVAGVCFTGSTATAQHINRAMAETLDPAAPLIAETGGLNAMIVDSTALAEQAVSDITASAFQSAGQRCSALRVLYLQSDIADGFLEMLYGAMDQLAIGDPAALKTDVGPVIDEAARDRIKSYIDGARGEGRVLKEGTAPKGGTFIAPTVIEVNSIADVREEVFGPVLHVARYEAHELDQVIDAINATGFGLTFGLHTRIDDRVQHIVDRVHVGNIYVNRNQIGAVVGSQPFGGEGLSGTGPKAGGPHYVSRFLKKTGLRLDNVPSAPVSFDDLQAAINQRIRVWEQSPLSTDDLPGPTGESNRLSLFPRGLILCAGPDKDSAEMQAKEARAAGCIALAVAPGVKDGLDGTLDPALLERLEGFDAVMCWGEDNLLRTYRRALAARDGQILPLICEKGERTRFLIERHVCVDTTASGGNTALLSASG